MEHEKFAEHGHRLIDWITEYMSEGYSGPVLPKTEPGAVMAQLPETPPLEAEPADAVFADFEDIVLPNVTHWNDPRFFAYFPANHSGPGILGDLLSAGLGVNAMSWATSPAATELEIRMIDWLGQMLGLPWRGCIQDTASSATLCAVLAARERLADINQTGFYTQKPMTAYTSEHAHSVLQKAVWIAGMGERFLRLIPADRHFAMQSEALREAVARDVAAGFRPAIVMSTVGTTSSTAVDPVAEIATVAREYDMWHHVDAALAGSAAILPEMRWLMDGVPEADSFCFNPHKWMFTNFDCSALFIKQPEALKKALSITPEFLKTAQDCAVENFRDWGVQLGRRFRALKLWYVIRCYGVSGLQAKIREHLRMAAWFADQVEQEAGLTLVTRPRLNTVCFMSDSDERSRALMMAVNTSGEAYLSHTVLDNRYVVRVAFGQTHSTFAHVEKLWQLVRRLHREMETRAE